MNIFLIGFMGSGKSTLGKKIASRLNYGFVDMDVEIEKEEKKSVAEIFQSQGESYFRNLEQNWLINFSSQKFVIATGGGAPCSKTNFEMIHKKGISIYLKSSSENLTNRLFQAKSKRPLINEFKQDKDRLLKFVQSKLAEREVFYEKCDLIINSIDVDAEKLDGLVKSIVETIEYRTSNTD